MEQKIICYGCMKENSLGQVKCPRCGFDEKQYKMNCDGNELPLGTILHNRYIVGRTVYTGGFGITYIGLDQNQDQTVIIKEYFPASMVSRDSKKTQIHDEELAVHVKQRKQQQFESAKTILFHEAEVRAEITDLPSVAGGYSCFCENNTIYIIMEYISGETLETHIRQFMNYMSVEEVKQIIEPLITSLRIFHKSGIIHRDINPQNILVRRDKSLVLIDFEAEKMEYLRQDRSMMQFLTNGYTAPEQYMENGKTGTWTDVYSLCAVIYYMLTGKKPEDAVLRMAKSRKEAEEPLRENLQKEGISKAFSEILIKGMSVESGERYQTMDDLYCAIYGKTKIQNEKIEQKSEEQNGKKKTHRKKSFWIFAFIFITILFSVVIYNNVESYDMINRIGIENYY